MTQLGKLWKTVYIADTTSFESTWILHLIWLAEIYREISNLDWKIETI